MNNLFFQSMNLGFGSPQIMILTISPTKVPAVRESS